MSSQLEPPRNYVYQKISAAFDSKAVVTTPLDDALRQIRLWAEVVEEQHCAWHVPHSWKIMSSYSKQCSMLRQSTVGRLELHRNEARKFSGAMMTWERKGGQLHCMWQLPRALRTVRSTVAVSCPFVQRLIPCIERRGSAECQSTGKLHLLVQAVKPSACCRCCRNAGHSD